MAEKSNKEKKTQENKPVWHNAETVTIKALKLVRNPKNENEVKGIKLIDVSEREIVYYPKKAETKSSLVGDWETEVTTQQYYPVSEFVVNSPMLNLLAKELKADKQEIVLSFSEKMFNGKMYYTVSKTGFDLIYYNKYHKNDKSNIDKQLTNKAKFEADTEMPME